MANVFKMMGWMKNINKKAAADFFLVVVTVISFNNVFAHHAIEAKFDPSASMELSGVVTKVDWRSPHVHIFMNVSGDGGLINWAAELEGPQDLINNGWHESTLRPGDAVTVEGIRARDNSRQLWANEVILSATGRAVYTVSDTRPVPPISPRPVPRWPDNQPALGALPGEAGGIWSYPSKTALVEDGVDVPMDKYGLLEDLNDAARVAPMQDWALARYKDRQERMLRDDPMYLNCKPPGGPRQYQSNLGFQLIEDRRNERVFVLLGSGNRNYHILYLDGRDPTGQVGGDDDNPLYYGRSVGQWEGDTLVINTSGFNEDFWFTNGGLPHTNLLSMVEKFTRTSYDTLHYEVTINDPGAYTRPWTASWDLNWVGGEELPFQLCQHNRQ